MSGRTDEVLSDKVTLPRVPPPPTGKGFGDILKYVSQGLPTFLFALLRVVEDGLTKIHRRVNELTSKGDNIADDAGVLTISARIHCVTGSSSIHTIAASPGFHGQAWLVSVGGGWELVSGIAGGNLAASAHPADGEVVTVIYDVATGLWHPSAASAGSGAVPYVVRGFEALAGTKNGVNTVFTLPGTDQFYLDANGEVFGVLFLNANPISPTADAPVAGNFEYRRDSLTQITMSEAPASTDMLAFFGLLVTA